MHNMVGTDKLDINVLVIINNKFNNFKLCIKRLDTYLQPLLADNINIVLHFNENSLLTQDIISYAKVHGYKYKCISQEHLSQLNREILLKYYDCSIIFSESNSLDVDTYISNVISTMSDIDFKFRAVYF
jgi:hypothetical protein